MEHVTCHNKMFWAGWVAAAVSSLIPRALLSAKGFPPAGKTNATFWWNHTGYLWELWSCKLDSFFICVSGGWMSWYKDHRRVKESWTVFLCYCHSKPAADLKQECAVWSGTSGWNSCQNLGLDLYSVLEQILVQLKVILYTVSFQFLLWRWCIRWSAMTIKSIFQSYIFLKVSGFKLMAELFSIQSICNRKMNFLLTIFHCAMSGFEHLLY